MFFFLIFSDNTREEMRKVSNKFFNFDLRSHETFSDCLFIRSLFRSAFQGFKGQLKNVSCKFIELTHA